MFVKGSLCPLGNEFVTVLNTVKVSCDDQNPPSSDCREDGGLRSSQLSESNDNSLEIGIVALNWLCRLA